MNTKLTLTIEESVISKAKIYAKRNGRSLSGIIENYLKIITMDQRDDRNISPVVKSLKGSFKAPVGFDYKKELAKGLAKKYLES